MINQFPAGRMWDEYDKAMARISELEDELDKWKGVAAELAGFMCSDCHKFSAICTTCSAAEIHNRYLALKGGEE